jgi:hypothetical protein
MSDKFLKVISAACVAGLIGLLKVCSKNIDSIGHSFAKSSDDIVRNSTEMVEHGADVSINPIEWDQKRK